MAKSLKPLMSFDIDRDELLDQDGEFTDRHCADRAEVNYQNISQLRHMPEPNLRFRIQL